MSTGSVRDLDRLREAASKGLLALLWAHLPLVAGLASLRGKGALAPALAVAGHAGAATLAYAAVGAAALATRLVVAVALIGTVSLLLAQMAGHPWQTDLHIYFFAALVVLATCCDWRVVVTAAAAVALHHLGLNLLLPVAVWPGEADLGRVVLHAVVVAVETIALAWLTGRLATLFARSAEQEAEAEAARDAHATARRVAMLETTAASEAGLQGTVRAESETVRGARGAVGEMSGTVGAVASKAGVSATRRGRPRPPPGGWRPPLRSCQARSPTLRTGSAPPPTWPGGPPRRRRPWTAGWPASPLPLRGSASSCA